MAKNSMEAKMVCSLVALYNLCNKEKTRRESSSKNLSIKMKECLIKSIKDVL